MIKLLYEWVKNLKKQGSRFWSLAYKVGKLIVNIIYPITQKNRTTIGIDNKSNIIVSLTTFPDRIKTVWITVATLLNQTKKPAKVILWLAEEQFPQKEKELPKSLKKLFNRGLEIRFCDDIKPHKKYYYSMLEFPDYILVTADDDMLYPENHLEILYSAYEKYKDSIICTWSHTFAFTQDKDFDKYCKWENYVTIEPSYQIVPIGCNGVLYPSHALDQDVFKKDKLMEFALYTDDLWLKCMSVKNNTKSINCDKNPLIYFNLIATQFSGLWKENTKNQNRNDNVWQQLMREYPEVKQKILNESVNEVFKI